MKKWINEIEKLYKEKQSMYVPCKCGCKTNRIYEFMGTKKICNWCGNYVYINKEEEFKDRLRSTMIKQKRKERRINNDNN